MIRTFRSLCIIIIATTIAYRGNYIILTSNVFIYQEEVSRKLDISTKGAIDFTWDTKLKSTLQIHTLLGPSGPSIFVLGYSCC